ncbi:NKG2-D type II integral membrane protein isoform X1 [Macrotis lagotis]|uniref:NKG2-D type II integral membrane protein isoform X1 n=1 Tax=Macrotis lagotis TaxID=92651 RepID=UPI003D694FED
MELIYDGQCRFNGETSEQQDYKSEVDLHHSSIKRQNESHIQMRSKYTARESPFLLHQFIAVAMAVRFFLMLVMLVFIFIHSSNPKAPSSTNGFYCGPCPKNWIYYKNICYLFSNESKSWNESQVSCRYHNSSLLKIYSKEDQDFLSLVKSYHWMGLVESTPNGSWMWEDGSPLSPDLLSVISVQKGHCAVYGSNFKGYIEKCSNTNTYICMQKVIQSNFDC